MNRPAFVSLQCGLPIPVLYEDRAAFVIDKPAGWLLAPDSWTRTRRNLQRALSVDVAAGQNWARSRGIKFLRFVHRLDSETTGALLFAKSAGGVRAYSELFRRQTVDKVYLAVVEGRVQRSAWTCELRLAPDPKQPTKIIVDRGRGELAETRFAVVSRLNDSSLVLCRPITGRTHQIRVHLADSSYPVLGDSLYSKKAPSPPCPGPYPLALRAVGLSYRDPFRKTPVSVLAPIDQFVRSFGFAGIEVELKAMIRDVGACRKMP